MNIIQTFKTANNSLMQNKARTILTMLGVIIGVFAVVMMVALGKGAQNYITDQFEELGSNLVFVSPGQSGFGNDPAESFTNNKIDDKHVKLIETQAKDFVKTVDPYVNVGATAEYKSNSYYASVIGTGAKATEVYNYKIDKGRFFTEAEHRGKKRVIVLGPLVATELFSANNPIGKTIKLGDSKYEVIGTFKEKGQNYDRGVLVPSTTAKDQFELNNLSGIAIKVKDENNIDLAMKKIELAMLKDLKPDQFSVLSQQDILETIQGILGILTTAIGGIAAISLLVGGIGIMNIMLVSVTERTREIGLRKAVGATPNVVASQFLTESVLISLGGGLIGLLLGYIASAIAQQWIRTEIPLWAVGLAFGFSAFVGILFGTYPAIKASKKDPIESLRYE
jgi:putative ABC transport system permease protein